MPTKRKRPFIVAVQLDEREKRELKQAADQAGLALRVRAGARADHSAGRRARHQRRCESGVISDLEAAFRREIDELVEHEARTGIER
jgi:hypothetical protein